MIVILLTTSLSLVGTQPAQVIGETAAGTCFAAAQALIVDRADVEACTRAVEQRHLTREERAGSWVNYGIVLRKADRPTDAVAAHDRAIALSPELAEAYLNRSAAYAQLGEDDRALADVTRALELGLLEPAVAHVNRALILERSGELDAAWRDLQAALALRPDYAPALRALERYSVQQNGAG